MFGRKVHSKDGDIASAETEKEVALQRARLFDTPVREIVRQEIELPNDEDGLGWACGIKTRRWAFKHFDRFEDKIHNLHSEGSIYDIGPWRLERLSDPYLTKLGADEFPVIGLRFRIFYNSEDVGSLEIRPFSEPVSKCEGGEYEAMIDIDIFPAPFLPHDHIFNFLNSCASELFPSENASSRTTAIVSALTATMWESIRLDSLWISLNFSYSGIVAV